MGATVNPERYLNEPHYHEAVELVRQTLAAELHTGTEDVPPDELDDWTTIIDRLAAYRSLESAIRSMAGSGRQVGDMTEWDRHLAGYLP